MAENDVVDHSRGGAPDPINKALQRGLEPQSLADLEGGPEALALLTPTCMRVMSRQATLNIGTIGHVAHGKSTLVHAISAQRTARFLQELTQNITIHLGYANAKIFKCPKCPAPSCYQSFKSSQPDDTQCLLCKEPMKLERHFSFLDCPGHEFLMTTMLNGAQVMDGALLLIAANEPFPQPQTREHLHAAEIMNLKGVVVVQNKIDLVKESAAVGQYHEIKGYLAKTVLREAPVVPVSAQLKYNVDYVLEHLCHFPIPTRTLNCPLRMTLIRSFDVNKPGDGVDKLVGGVLGGSVQRGVIRVGQDVEVRPGVVYNVEGKWRIDPIVSAVTQLQAEDNQLHYAIPGGLIAVGTKIDPCLTRQNKLTGQLLGDPGSLPSTWVELVVQYFLLTRVVGISDSHGVSRPLENERMILTIGGRATAATVLMVKGDLAKLALSEPVSCEKGARFTICRMVRHSWRLVGYGTVKNGVEVQQLCS
jgi:translation initiation factor 2 subunit 3